MRWFQWLFGSILLALAVVAVSYLQHRFDLADLDKAVKAVEKKFLLTGCQGEVISRFWGQVKVNCEGKVWIVDVVKGEIGDGSEKMSR